MRFHLNTLAIGFALCSTSVWAAAQSDATADKLESIVVKGCKASGLSGVRQLDREDIAKRPTRDGNITNLLKSHPSVQFSSHSNTSLQRGEIKPADGLIHGAVSYQNNYMLDGLSTNSDLNPAAQTSVTATRLGASDEQGFYVDARLIEGVVVYEHDIPVEFGGFTGGAVDAQTRAWRGENRISVFTRATASGWSRIHADDALNVQAATGDVSHPAQFQKDFTKCTYGFSAEWGLTDRLGFVVGYSRRESRIPTLRVPGTRVTIARNPDYDADDYFSPEAVLIGEDVPGGLQTQKRTADNLFAKAMLYATPDTEFDLALAYSGYRAKSFLTTVADYEDEHDGLHLAASIRHAGAAGRLEAVMAYTQMTDRRNNRQDHWAQVDFYRIASVENPEGGVSTVTTDMQSSASGGFGDLESRQKVWTAKAKFTIDPVEWLGVSHEWSTGGEASLTRATYTRDRNYYRCNAQVAKTDYMDNVLFYTTRWRGGAYEADYNQAALFLQHLGRWKRLSVRSGLRAEYDDFTGDVYAAPRLSASWDVLGNGATTLTAGAGRYYGRNILTYALYKPQNGGMGNAYSFQDDASAPSPGTWFSANDFDGLGRLKTPYSDEWTLGLSQRWLGLTGALAYVHRSGHDEIRSHARVEGGYDSRFIRTFNNDGRSEHDSVVFTLSNAKPFTFAHALHRWRLNAVWQETTSNTAIDEGYSEPESGKTVDMDYVWYDGRVMRAEALDATDFNIPVKLNLELTPEFKPWGLTFFNNFFLNGRRDQAVRDEGEYYKMDTNTAARTSARLGVGIRSCSSSRRAGRGWALRSRSTT